MIVVIYHIRLINFYNYLFIEECLDVGWVEHDSDRSTKSLSW
jgi:hypothetical protein